MVAAHHILPRESRIRGSLKYCTSALSCKLAAHEDFGTFIQCFNTRMYATRNYTLVLNTLMCHTFLYIALPDTDSRLPT